MGLFRSSTGLGAAPIEGVDVILADLDGVVYKGKDSVVHAVDSLNAYAHDGIRVGYITNNAARTDESVAEQLRGFGLETNASDVVTSPQAAVEMLRGLVDPGALVLVVGGDGLTDELAKAGFRITRSAEDSPDAVVQGFAPDVSWTHLAEASYALARDIPWVATNQDWTIPRERGIAPGNGTLVSAVHTAVAKLPLVAGKPETPLFEAAQVRFGATNPIMVGDRLDTDIKGARAAGFRSALVLTGVDGPKQLIAASPLERPDFILADLRGLREPYPNVTVTHPAAEVIDARVGDERCVLEGIELKIRSKGKNQLDLLRAACAAIWNSDKLIYALQIPESLYQQWDAQS
ncbi:HAD-IIA family hydrolase [Gulosibacter molinativorax]|uniref:Haloacid dehalogenase n=1 Tax=Gulosibacter molinativorax TaxID=256821 RepID=A0ABT7CB06_9MICO|nr:HAD-IIA family hydrolase [Gulosibacter molinativorax]MDJ1372383.1 haloacid dehalogenase [Gulosibacter molinativorax]QUY61098.1 Putative hydrolase YutF [Gulosibacter molinativorax]